MLKNVTFVGVAIAALFVTANLAQSVLFFLL
jgi:hypothetical protein